jgi:hypothetical protein
MWTYQILIEVVALNFVAFMLLMAVSFMLVGLPGLLPAPVLLLGLVAWYARVPFEVLIRPDRLVEFRSPARRTVIHADEIVSIELPLRGGGFVAFRHRRGVIRLTSMMNDFPDLIARLQELNPGIRIRRSV